MTRRPVSAADDRPVSTVTRRPVSTAAMAKRLRHLPSALLASGILLIIGVAAGAVMRGPAGAAGAAAGVVLVALSYTISSVVIAWADIIDPKLIMPIGLAAYAVKFIAIGLVMAAIASAGWAGLIPMGMAIIAAVLGWTATQSWWTYRAKIPYVDIDGE